MNVSISLEMWMQCGPSHVKCGCYVDPPHLHNLNVDLMWSNVDVLWSNVDFQMWINAYILRIRIMEIYVHSLINTNYMWTTTLKMWIHHISTSWQCGSTTYPQCGVSTPTHLTIWLIPFLQIIPGRLEHWAVNNFLGHSGWCMIVIISSFENNLVKFSFENNLVILVV